MYDAAFYDQIRDGARSSAKKIVPEVIEIFHPRSVIDYGCGTGSWLYTFFENCVQDIQGVDGDYVDQSKVPVPFIIADLTQPFIPPKKYDLAMSLEVAEHLPESSADIFVDTLCRSSDHILFSAAVPGQNGVNHINEQWPSYWVPKFVSRGYSCSSNFRFEFWHDEDIENWYRQNILLFSKGFSGIDSSIVETYFLSTPPILDVIHYNNWKGKI